MNAVVQIDRSEAVLLGANNTGFYSHTFFPRTFRQGDAPWAPEAWATLDDPQFRRIQQRSFRGSAKTTRVRTFMSKRIAYGVSRTILYLGATEGHAARSIQWLRAAVEKNKLWSETFGLRPGKKWQEQEIEIENTVTGTTVWIMALGITSQGIRGVNFDDYRPDLIVCDDILTDENTASKEQREKIGDLFHGAIKQSLAPVTEAPLAKLVMLQTPMHREDLGAQLAGDPDWATFDFGCWTRETVGLEIDQQESSWPERFTTEELRRDKRAAVRNNKLSVFSREMECRLIASEKSAFRREWLRYYTNAPRGVTYIIIDPVPPPSTAQIEKNLLTKDYEAIIAVRRSGGAYYVLACKTNRGHEPNWTVATAFEMAETYGATGIGAEDVAYQRVLQWILRKEMTKRGRYWAIIPLATKNQPKYLRITSVLSGPASEGKVYVRENMLDLISQWEQYPGVSHDDILDAMAHGVKLLSAPLEESADQGSGTLDLDESEYGELPERLLARCP